MALTPEQIQSLQNAGIFDQSTAQAKLGALNVPETSLYPASNSAVGVGAVPEMPQPTLQPGLQGIGLSSGMEPVAPPAPVKAPQADLGTIGMNNQISGYQGIANSQAALAKDEALALGGIGMRMSTDAIKQEEILAEKQKAYDDFAKTDAAAQKELAANMPGRDFWADRSTNDKITAGIAMWLGGIGAAITGKENGALAVINSAIERDLKNQVIRYNALKDKRDGGKEAFGMALKMYGDKESALLGLQKNAYDRTILQVKQYEALAKGTEAAEKAKIMTGVLQSEKAKIDATLAGQMAKAQADKAEFISPLLGGAATSKEGAKILNESAANATTAKTGLKDLLAIANTPGAKADFGETAARANTIAKTLQGALRTEILGPGTVNDGERAMLEGLIRDPSKMFSLPSKDKAALTELMNRIDISLMNKARANGISTDQFRKSEYMKSGVNLGIGKPNP